MEKKKGKKWVPILVGFLLVACVAGYFVWQYVKQPYPDTKDKKSDFVLTLAAFKKEYLANDSATNAKYHDKIVEVSGVVSLASYKDTTGVVELSDTTGGENVILVCEFQKQHIEDVKSLKENMPIVVKGVCTGVDIVTNEEVSLEATEGEEEETTSMLTDDKRITMIRCAVIKK
jgi:hypothetical protein